MSRGSLALVLFAVGCASQNPPQEVALEAPAFDVAACARRDPSCTIRGPVTPIEVLLPSGDEAVSIAQGGSIASAIARPAGANRLVWLVLGVRAYGEPRHLSLAFGSTRVEADPVLGLTRIEVQVPETADPSRVEISTISGTVDLLYAVGRWD